MYVKIHQTDDSIVTAICDEKLVGKTFSEDGREITVSERFYKGDQKSEEEVTELLQNASNLNLIGEDTINLALKLKIITKDSIMLINKIPHAQVFEI